MTRPVLTVLYKDDLPTGMSEIEAIADVRCTTADGLGDALEGADALLLWDFFSSAVRDVWHRAGDLKWIHVAAAGVDKLLFDDLVDSSVVVTNSRGIFDRPIAEYVLATILAMAKDLHGSWRLQQRSEWRHRETERIDDRSALIVGAGAIGRETARLLRACGMSVAGVGRSPRSNDPDFGDVHASDELASVIGRFDYVVLIAPLTEQTRGMIDARVLNAMRPGVRIINVGRGELIVDADLVAALESGHVDHAALDVFPVEPLPADSPYWSLENVWVSSHLSGDAVGWLELLSELFRSNLRRYASGEELVNVVDKRLGFVPN